MGRTRPGYPGLVLPIRSQGSQVIRRQIIDPDGLVGEPGGQRADGRVLRAIGWPSRPSRKLDRRASLIDSPEGAAGPVVLSTQGANRILDATSAGIRREDGVGDLSDQVGGVYGSDFALPGVGPIVPI